MAEDNTIINDIPDELVIELGETIKLNGGTYDTITVREPTAKQMMLSESLLKGAVSMDAFRSYQIMLVSVVAGVPKGVVEQMKVSKVIKAFNFIKGFVESSESPLA